MDSLDKIHKLNPFTHQPLYQHPKNSLLDIVKTIQTANKVYSEWKTTTLSDRIGFLEKIIQHYTLKKNEIILSESLDQGLPLSFTEAANYNMGLELFHQFKLELQNHQESAQKIYSPNGVMSIVLSWNLSNRLFIEKAISAWLAGNTVIVKVSSVAVSTALQWQDILAKAQIPDGTIQFVITDDVESKKILVSHPGIKAVAVTGTLKTCSDIVKVQSAMAEKQFKKVQLLSGSKNSCLALNEPNEKNVDQILESFLLGQGQMVWNSSRLFILEKHQPQWVAALEDRLSKLKPADSPTDASWWGPIIKASDRAHYDHYYTQARSDHGKIITTQKNSLNESFVNPVFTFDMSNCSELQQDQLRLPIFVLSAVKYGFDIPKYSNVSYYGHAANIFSEGVSTDKIVQQLDVGHISLNKWSVYNSSFMPAVKQSAYGIQGHQIFGEFNSNVKIIS